jgi:hypothetical protein
MLEATPIAKIPLLLDTVVALLIFLLSGAIGTRLLRRLRLPDLMPTERGIFAFTLGLGVVSYVPFALFALFIGKPAVVAGVLTVLFALFWRDELRIVRWIGGQVKRAGELPRPTLALLVALVPLLFVTFLQALCPPTDPDGLHYHLTAPQFYLREGRFFYAPTFLHLNWPLGIEMLFGAGMAFNRHFASGLIQFGIGLVLLLAVYCLCLRITPDRSKAVPAAVGSIAVALSFPLLRGEMTWAYIDLGLGLYTILAGYALFLSWQGVLEAKGTESIAPFWILAAICAGLSATAKLPGLFTVGLVAIMIAGQSRRQNTSSPLKVWGRPAVIAFGIGLLIVAPWLIRGWLQTGTPIYPYFARILPVVDWSPAFQERLNEYLQYFLTLKARRLTPQQIIQVRLVACAILAVMALVACVLPALRRVRPLLFYVIALTFLQIASSGIYLRYFLPYVPLMIALAIWGIHRLLEFAPVRVSALGLACLWLWGLHKFPQQVRGELAALIEAGNVAVGSTSREAYLSSKLPGFVVAQWCNANLPADAVIALGIYDAHASLYERRTLATHIWLQDAIRYDSAERLRADLARLGTTHLIVNETVSEPVDLAQHDKESILRGTKEMPALVGISRTHGKRIYQQGNYSIFALKLNP